MVKNIISFEKYWEKENKKNNKNYPDNLKGFSD